MAEILTPEWFQLVLFFGLLIALVRPLGRWMAAVFQGDQTFLDRLIRPVERLLYRLAGIDSEREMTWKEYVAAVLIFNFLGWAALYILLRLQHLLPGSTVGAMPALSAFNAAASFTTNTNWQSYVPETSVNLITQMLGLGVQNFLSAGVGMAVLAALIRGFVRHSTDRLGNFWVDLNSRNALRTDPAVSDPFSPSRLSGCSADVQIIDSGGDPITLPDKRRGTDRPSGSGARTGRLADRNQAAGVQRRRFF